MLQPWPERTFQGFLDIVLAAPRRRNEGEVPRGTRSPGGVQHALLTDAEFRDDALIALGIVCFQVVEQAATLADEHEQAPA